MSSSQNPPDKICILRLSAIGDVTHAVPVVRAIQKQWSQTEIVWVCGKLEHKLLRLIDGVRFIVFDKTEGLRAYARLYSQLRHERFDVLLHMQVAARANFASLCVRSDRKIGWDKNRSRDLHTMFIGESVKQVAGQHQVQGFLSFARALGLEACEPDWSFPVTERAKRFVSGNIEADGMTMVISACSSHPARNWLAERYAQVADYAMQRYDLQVVLSGGPAAIERQMSRDIMVAVQGKVIDLTGKDTLEELVGLMSMATVVISPDTGPAHLANAVGVPVIGLYACTSSKRSGPYKSLQYCVDKFDEAAERFLHTSSDQLRWGTKIEKPDVMSMITVDEVCQRLDQVMAEID